MQMNDKGIICSGYFYYNPTVRDYGTVTISGPPTSLSYSPGIGEYPKIKIYNRDNTDSYYTLVFNGTYVTTKAIGTFSFKSEGTVGGSSIRSFSPDGVRYA